MRENAERWVTCVDSDPNASTTVELPGRWRSMATCRQKQNAVIVDQVGTVGNSMEKPQSIFKDAIDAQNQHTGHTFFVADVLQGGRELGSA